jgi:hypothetical protein
MQDTNVPMKSDDDTIPSDSALWTWNQNMVKSGVISGRRCDIATQYAQWMREAGFVDVVELKYKWPQNPWPKDPRDKYLARWVMANIMQGLQAFSLALMTRFLGMSREEVEVLLVDVRKDMLNRKIHSYWPM